MTEDEARYCKWTVQGCSMNDDMDKEGLAESLYPVKCVCGFRGMSDDCRQNLCPNCGLRVTREF
jgi:hypothetical protein